MKKLIMLIGPSGSGKSTWARNYVEHDFHTKIVSSDHIRFELFGDESIQTKPQKVFQIARERMLSYFKNGHDVIFDATNLSIKDRKQTLQVLNKDIRRIALIFAIPYQQCVENQSKRSRAVDSSVIHNQICKFQVPVESENFDEIFFLKVNETEVEKLREDVWNKVQDFDQMNEHHSRKLFDHCYTTAQSLPFEIEYDSDLYQAASIHDYGKAFTQTFFDLKGNPSLNAHYYGHDSYGAYLYCCCCDSPKLYIAQLINYHMLPYFMKTDKSIQKWSEILGSHLWQDLQVLNAADKRAK